MHKYQNWLTGAKVTLTNQYVSDEGQDMAEYVRDKKRMNETGRLIESHQMPQYVFDQIFKEVRG